MPDHIQFNKIQPSDRIRRRLLIIDPDIDILGRRGEPVVPYKWPGKCLGRTGDTIDARPDHLLGPVGKYKSAHGGRLGRYISPKVNLACQIQVGEIKIEIISRRNIKYLPIPYPAGIDQVEQVALVIGIIGELTDRNTGGLGR